ncbi:MAG TPA: hypothetical protein VK880_14910 [Anaerolineales bacterium]|nr:hypothetical protein [Anaerolineales bacterium]
MRAQREKKNTLLKFLGNIVPIFLGLAVALGLMETLLRAFPNWVPAEVRVNPPARRVKAGIDETYALRLSDGDLFHHMRGIIEPLSADEDQVVAHVHMLTDANGFRNAPPEKATYGIVALGDSFTRASGVGSPWTQKLSEHTGVDVLNLADVGFGPQDELKALQQHGLKKQPQWVILAYFGGNDLYDAAAYEQANPFILLRFGRYMLGQGIEAWHRTEPGGAQVAASATYRYPLSIEINNKELELAFFSSYISWLSLNRETIAASQNYDLVRETILQMQRLSQSVEANFLLVYVPSKSHVYLPYLQDTETVTRVFMDVLTLELDEAGYIQFAGQRATPELTYRYMNDQVSLLADFAEAHSMHFLDLTPIFQQEASTGAELYYPFDTHWNQPGHDLAAQSIYNYLKEMLPNT